MLCRRHRFFPEAANFRVLFRYTVICNVPLEKELENGGLQLQRALVIEIGGSYKLHSCLY